MEEYSKISEEVLKQAIAQETSRFEEFYRWLEKSMPKVFFKEVKLDWVSRMAHSLMGFQEENYFTEIYLKKAAISLCIDSPEADVTILQSYPLYGIKNYTTYISREPLPFPDIFGYLRVATIYFTEAFEPHVVPLEPDRITQLKSFLQARHTDWSSEKCDTLISEIDPRFMRTILLDLQIVALEMLERAQTRDDCQYEVHLDENWEEKNVPSMAMVLAWKNVPKYHFLYRLATLVYRHGLVMRRVNAAYLKPYQANGIFMLSFSLHGAKGEAAWEAADLSDLLQEMVTLKYFGAFDRIDATFVKTHLIRGNLGNFLRTAIHFIHQILVHVDPNLYTIDNIEEGLCRHPELTIKLCKAFEYKFHPLHIDLVKFEKMREEFVHLVTQLDTGQEIHDVRRKNILLQGINFVIYTLKTNFFQSNKTAFAFRLDPSYLDAAPFERKKMFSEMPFGIFFVHGLDFIAFHIRFKDLSRGGLRTVYPKIKERMLAERNTVFTECYNLALTQHRKNKDIPEGGAKGIIFLKPYEQLASEAAIYSRELEEAGLAREEIESTVERFISEQQQEFLYQAQRTFIENLLTIVNCNVDGSLRVQDIVDYWKKPEYIYLGPDENLNDTMIEWIAEESKKVHYKPGGAFISGKPRIGINHKEYGVTSLGVEVYVEELLRYLNINPEKEVFTVKMTGGPDGDVAGNQILNLYKYFPQTAKLTALTDVSGTIYDPQGLDLEICTQLFYAVKPINHYPPEKLSLGGFLLDREKKREPTPYLQQTLCWRKKESGLEADWISGNEMHALYRNNVHQVKTDIFIPCGGRPRTLNDGNYKDFFDKSGKPTARGIVEGANLYISPWARHYLQEAGVLIIKDSSANKGGVISSSFEIVCGLCLTDEEFLKHKQDLIKEILVRIKQCALNEARLLLSEHKTTHRMLTDLSDEISKKINFFTDQLLAHLNTIPLPETPQDPLIQCFLNYCPKTLVDQFQDRLLQEIPENHKQAIIASHIASQLVYQRGLHWYPTLVDILPLLLKENLL